MKKIILTLLFLILVSKAYAYEGYVSPEVYAINEADLTDYYNIPAQAKPDIDHLDNPVKIKSADKTSKKEKKEKKNTKSYDQRMIYKMAKWWDDKTYKYENPYHGEKHEIKVKVREEYERLQNEK